MQQGLPGDARADSREQAANARDFAGHLRTSDHTACCPALALWVLGQCDMARAAADLCEAGQ